MEERQPLFETVRVLENHVGRAREPDAPPLELLLRGVNVRDPEVENRVVVKVGYVDDRAILDHQANSPAIEEC